MRKATPYPYTTDYPVVLNQSFLTSTLTHGSCPQTHSYVRHYLVLSCQIPPKPEPKRCTRPEPFRLESLVKHEQETWKQMEERRRMEEEEAKMRNFKAQPVLAE